jgi:hypothetical protein
MFLVWSGRGWNRVCAGGTYHTLYGIPVEYWGVLSLLGAVAIPARYVVVWMKG